MPKPILWLSLLILLLMPSLAASAHSAERASGLHHLRACADKGWKKADFEVAGLDRTLLWKAPSGPWTKGGVLLLHGGGGSAVHFCGDGRLIQPQIDFAQMAVDAGFAVFALESTDDVVTDANGDVCGKRFDFTALERPNVDLPYIDHIIKRLMPALRPQGSDDSVFMTGLSSGGYMTIRAAVELGDAITAFAPISAGDPLQTIQKCDESLSPRKSAKGILVDQHSLLNITENGACAESPAGLAGTASDNPTGTAFKQFHHRYDGIVDISCMRKAETALELRGHRNDGSYVITRGWRKKLLLHLWLNEYNEHLIDFFARH